MGIIPAGRPSVLSCRSRHYSCVGVWFLGVALAGSRHTKRAWSACIAVDPCSHTWPTQACIWQVTRVSAVHCVRVIAPNAGPGWFSPAGAP